MLAFNHIMAGSIVALTVPAPLVPVVAFATHYVLDLFPHSFGEEPPYSRLLKIQIAVDALISLVTVGFILWLFPPSQWFILAVGAFFGLLPDMLWIFWKRGGPKWFQKFLDWAHWIQWAEVPYGYLFDAFYGFLMAFALIVLSPR
jgi:hypothetical protein